MYVGKDYILGLLGGVSEIARLFVDAVTVVHKAKRIDFFVTVLYLHNGKVNALFVHSGGSTRLKSTSWQA